MQRLLVSFSALALVAALGAPPAQAQVGFTFDVGGGVTLPLGQFGDNAGTGFNGQIGLGITPAEFPVGFKINGHYMRNPFDGTTLDSQILAGTGNVVFQFAVGPDTRFRPYLIAGAGVYNSKAVGDDEVEIDDGGSTDLGINGGAGFNFAAGNVGLFLEGRFHNIFIGDEEFDIGDNRNLVNVNVGLRFGGEPE